MTLRLGHLDYLNTLPLYHHLPKSTDRTLVAGCPAALNAALCAGDLDVSLVSSWTYLTHADTLTLLPDFCIATQGEVGSVHLYHKKPLAQLDAQPLAITTQSASSAQLLRLICRSFWHITPDYRPLHSLAQATDYPAFMLIGDDALTHPTFLGYDTIDLAAIWQEKTQLPMTFAVLAAHHTCTAYKPIETAMETSLRAFEHNPEPVITTACARSGLPLKIIEHYYGKLTFRFHAPQRDGLRTFAALSDCSIQEGTV